MSNGKLGVHATYTDAVETPENFLMNAHPTVGTVPIITQRQHFYRLTQPGERGTFFNQTNKSGTSKIGKVPNTTPEGS